MPFGLCSKVKPMGNMYASIGNTFGFSESQEKVSDIPSCQHLGLSVSTVSSVADVGGGEGGDNRFIQNRTFLLTTVV